MKPNQSKLMFVPIRQRGVALWLIFAAIGLLAALAAALAAASRSSSASTAGDIHNTYVSGILSQSAEIKQGFDHMIVNGGVLSTMTFTQAVAPTDLFGSGNAVLPTAPDKAFLTGIATPWVFYTPGASASSAGAGVGATITGVGAGKNWLSVLKGLTSDVCAAINLSVANTAVIPTISSSLAGVIGTSTTAVDLSSGAGTVNRASLCVKDSSGAYDYYSVLLEQ